MLAVACCLTRAHAHTHTHTHTGGAFDPLNLADEEDEEKAFRLKTAEIKHGRLAMIAFLGFGIQAAVTGEGALGSLAKFASTLGQSKQDEYAFMGFGWRWRATPQEGGCLARGSTGMLAKPSVQRVSRCSWDLEAKAWQDIVGLMTKLQEKEDPQLKRLTASLLKKQ
eukprot:1147712-Pelagomonas_calceolata.AAC.4